MAEIWGAATHETVLETVRDTVKTILDAIVWTDISPLISYTYDNHRIADIAFNGASVEVTNVTKVHTGRDGSSSPSGPILTYYIQVELRIHTAVAGRHNDYDTFWRLANSLSNVFSANNKLADQMHITDPGTIEGDLEFEESDTVGGNLVFVVLYSIGHEAA